VPMRPHALPLAPATDLVTRDASIGPTGPDGRVRVAGERADSVGGIQAANAIRTAAGMIIDAKAGRGLAGHTVGLASPELWAMKGEVSGKTDANGAFAIELPAGCFWPGMYYSTWVLDTSGTVVFSGSTAVGGDMTIAVPAPMLLHGCILDVAKENWAGSNPELWILVPSASGRLQKRKTAVDEDGRFSLVLRSQVMPRHAVVRLAAPGQSAAVPVPIDELVSPTGALVSCPVTDVRVCVRDMEGNAVQGAKVRLWQEATLEAAELLTSAEGACRLRLGTGQWRWSATKDGYLQQGGGIEVTGVEGSVECKLPSVRACCVLRGEVVSGAHGRPVAGCIVTAWPGEVAGRSRQRGEAALPFAGCECDESGRFQLIVPSDDEIWVTVANREYAASRGFLLGPKTRDVRVTVGMCARVVINRMSRCPWPATSGRTRGLMVDRFRERTIPFEGDPPLAIGRVPLGEYNVYIVDDDGSYGQSAVDLRKEGDEASVVVDTIPGSWFEGHVCDTSGRPVGGATCRVLQDAWPDEVSHWAGAGITDESGCFRVFGGLALSTRLEVSGVGVGTSSHTVQVGRKAEIVLRRKD
jgi:hypothetical protein